MGGDSSSLMHNRHTALGLAVCVAIREVTRNRLVRDRMDPRLKITPL